MITNLKGGLMVDGAPVLPYKAGIGVPNGGSTLSGTKHLWVHGNLGGDGNDGLSPDKPLLTMAAAMAQIGSGDIIHLNGKVTESITAPAGVFDVTIIGEGNAPRHCDAHTSSNGYSSAQWSSASTTTSQLTLQQQGWRLANILFDAPTTAAALVFPRNASSGDAERDSSHTEILGCRFASGSMGIQITGTENVFNVKVKGCTFNDLTTAIDSAGGYAYRWQISDNEFVNNTNHIDVGFTQTTIKHNTFGNFTTMGIDLTGGANNTIWGNYLSGTYSNVGGYVAGTDDEWGGNFNSLTGGVTAADPA